MAGHPPFGAQIILNGHEYVACQASRAHLDFVKEGNCFTQIADAADLASIADTLSEARTVGRLVQVCEQWIYSACLCFALGIEEQQWTAFRYAYRSALLPILRGLDGHLARWARRKYKGLSNSRDQAYGFLRRVHRRAPTLFVHWRLGVRP